jgi:hypothetical protein
MQARMSKNPAMIVPGALQALQALGKSAEQGAVPAATIGLIQLRASQINGCSVCVDSHARFETPISIFVQEGRRSLITPYGVVNWVRNLRAAAEEATLTRGRRTEKFHALELEPVTAAPIFREAVRTGPDGIPAVFVRGYRHFILSSHLNVAANASLEEFEHEVLTHPVFLLQSAI